MGSTMGKANRKNFFRKQQHRKTVSETRRKNEEKREKEEEEQQQQLQQQQQQQQQLLQQQQQIEELKRKNVQYEVEIAAREVAAQQDARELLTLHRSAKRRYIPVVFNGKKEENFLFLNINTITLFK